MSPDPRFRFDFGVFPPLCRIHPGKSIEINLPDSDGLGPDLRPQPREWFDLRSKSRFPGNPVYGPVHVVGAQPGDSLEISFEKITPNRSVARTWIAPNHGFLPAKLVRGSLSRRMPSRMILWKLSKRTARISNPFGSRVPAINLAPFLGCVGTTDPAQTRLSSLEAGSHGGNIDLPDLQVGSTLWLPVSVPGGLLYLGDMHAAQGQGECVGGALEVSGSIRVRCRLNKKARLRWPRYRTHKGRGCIVVQPRLENGIRLSLAEMIQWLVEEGWNRYDAYLVISQTCQFKLGGINARWCVVACFLPDSNLAR